MTKSAVTLALARTAQALEFAMAFSLFVYLSAGAFDQGFPILATFLAIFMGASAYAFSPWGTAPVTAKDCDDATYGTIIRLLVRIVFALSATGVVLFALSVGGFPR